MLIIQKSLINIIFFILAYSLHFCTVIINIHIITEAKSYRIKDTFLIVRENLMLATDLLKVVSYYNSYKLCLKVFDVIKNLKKIYNNSMTNSWIPFTLNLQILTLPHLFYFFSTILESVADIMLLLLLNTAYFLLINHLT